MIEFVISSANNEQDILRAVEENTARGLPCPVWGANTGSIAVCGNGPSLGETYPSGGPIAALNGAWKTLVKNGVMPDYIIAHDPATQNVVWFDDAPDDPVYILSSRMHPSVFDKLKGKKIFLWHIHDEPEAKTGTKHLIGGGFTIGCQSLNLLNLMGFTHFDCYGYDSCYSIDGRHHSTKQDWNLTAPRPYQVGEAMFIAEPWMAAQVQEFLKQIEANKYNYTVDVKSSGMLKAALDHNTLEILYDLEVAPGSFDFFDCMINAENYRKCQGYSRAIVNFRSGSDGGFRPNEILHVPHRYKTLMLNNVVRPMLKMFAFQEVSEVSEKAVQFQYTPKETLDHFRATGEMAEYRPSDEAIEWAKQYKDFHVITLREAEHWPQRNSNVGEWVRFAKTLGSKVVFVRDTAKADDLIDGFEICPEASKDIHKRLALYRAAKMNYFVATGPGQLIKHCRETPYICFTTNAEGYPFYDPKWLKEQCGLDEQYPWRDPEKQRIFRLDDTYENLMFAHQSMSKVDIAA